MYCIFTVLVPWDRSRGQGVFPLLAYQGDILRREKHKQCHSLVRSNTFYILNMNLVMMTNWRSIHGLRLGRDYCFASLRNITHSDIHPNHIRMVIVYMQVTKGGGTTGPAGAVPPAVDKWSWLCLFPSSLVTDQASCSEIAVYLLLFWQ